MKERTAIVFGATGLVGKALVQELCNLDNYILIKVFVRTKTKYFTNNKIEEIIIDFEKFHEYEKLIKGNDLFICLGTTIKKAGSVKRMEEIDRDLPVKIASIASSLSVEKLAVVSSIGADPNSVNTYLRIKGEMEKELMRLKFITIAIVRPSILLGERNERRRSEEIGKILIVIFGIFLFGKLKKYRGIQAKNVARSMIMILHDMKDVIISESDRLQEMSDRYVNN